MDDLSVTTGRKVVYVTEAGLKLKVPLDFRVQAFSTSYMKGRKKMELIIKPPAQWLIESS